MDVVSLKGTSKAMFSGSTVRNGGTIPWSPSAVDFTSTSPTFSYGVTAGKVSQVVDDNDVAIAISTTVSINLKDGTTLKDFDQANMALANLKFLYIINSGTVPLDVDFAPTNGLGTNGPVTDVVTLLPSNALGPFFNEAADGWTVDATHKIIDVINASGVTAGKIAFVFAGDKI